MRTKKWAMGLVIFCTLLTSSAQLFYKFGVATIVFTDISTIILNPALLMGLALYAVGGGLLVISFRGGEVSVLYPIIATSFIWVSFLSIIFLGEEMNLFRWLGVTAIFIGIASIGYGSRKAHIAAGEV